MKLHGKFLRLLSAAIAVCLTAVVAYAQAGVTPADVNVAQSYENFTGGVVNAITAYSQTVEDGDDAYELETRATSLLGV